MSLSGMLFSTVELAQELDTELFPAGLDVPVRGVVCDSREVTDGDMFVALKGERTDGHRYVKSAFSGGASAALVNSSWAQQFDSSTLPEGKVLVVVDESPVLALGKAAQWYSKQFSIPTVAITGSLGKTTTKDFTASIMGSEHSVLKSRGNYNTEIGIPLTLFRMRDHHSTAVLEVAMRKPGDLSYLAKLTRPQVGVLTNIAESHMEFFGSLQEIAAGKAELFEFLSDDEWAVINGQDRWGRWIAQQTTAQKMFYHCADGNSGLECCADHFPQVTARNITLDKMARASFTLQMKNRGEFAVTLPVAGEHHVMNALAAVCVGMIYDIEPDDIALGLNEANLTGMRSEWMECKDGLLILNDAYNSSPTSCKAALRALMKSQVCGRRIAVLGDMLELGPIEESGHHEVGRYVAEVDPDFLVTVGSLAEQISHSAEKSGFDQAKTEHFEEVDELMAQLPRIVRSSDSVLVKASRGRRLERCVQLLGELFGGYTTEGEENTI